MRNTEEGKKYLEAGNRRALKSGKKKVTLFFSPFNLNRLVLEQYKDLIYIRCKLREGRVSKIFSLLGQMHFKAALYGTDQSGHRG